MAVALFDIEHLVVLNTPPRPGPRELRAAAGRAAPGGGAPQRGGPPRHRRRPSMSMAARLSGGLFAAMLTGVPGWHEARGIVRVLLDRVSGRYFAGDEEIVLSASVGSPSRPPTAHRGGAHPEGRAGGVGGAGERWLDPLLRPVQPPRDRAQPRDHAPAGRRPRPRRAERPLPAAGGGGRLAHRGPRRRCCAGTPRSWAPCRPPSSSPWPRSSGLMVPIGTLGAAHRLRAGPRLGRPGLPPTRMAMNVSLCQLIRGDLPSSWTSAWPRRASSPRCWSWSCPSAACCGPIPDILRQLHAIRAAGRARGGRRLRHRRLRDRLPEAVPARHAQGRPVVHARRVQLVRRRRHHLRHDRHGPPARPARRGRRRRGTGADGPAHRYGCNEYQGFLFSPGRPRRRFGDMLKTRQRDRQDPCRLPVMRAAAMRTRRRAGCLALLAVAAALASRARAASSLRPIASSASRWSRACRRPRCSTCSRTAGASSGSAPRTG